MTRLSLIVFLSLAFAGTVFGAPREAITVRDVRARTSQKFSYCDDVDSLQTIKDVFVSQAHPEPGQKVTVTVNAHTPDVIPKDAKLYADDANSPDDDPVNLCAAAKKAYPATPCPIPKGDYTFQYSVRVPDDGEFPIKTLGRKGDETLFCFDFSPS